MTGVPEHTVLDGVVMLIESVPVALTTIVIALDVAVAGDTQVPVGVMTQVTILLLANADDV